jgi:hypothetical protein
MERLAHGSSAAGIDSGSHVLKAFVITNWRAGPTLPSPYWPPSDARDSPAAERGRRDRSAASRGTRQGDHQDVAHATANVEEPKNTLPAGGNRDTAIAGVIALQV